MNVSFNEVEVLSKRAARGAGLSWGMAEEAGKATRWLMAHGLPGLKILLDILEHNDGLAGENTIPVSTDGAWRAPAGNLCPLTAGTILCDRAREITDKHDINLGSVLQPLALAPFLATAARISGGVFELTWGDVVMVIEGREFSTTAANTYLTSHHAESVRCRRVEQVVADPVKRVTNCKVDKDAWARLNDYSHRTFAPASEASRLAGAGAGLTDND